jgi:hypothetical protein
MQAVDLGYRARSAGIASLEAYFLKVALLYYFIL